MGTWARDQVTTCDNKGTFWQEDLDDLDAFLLALGFLLQRGSSYCLTRRNP